MAAQITARLALQPDDSVAAALRQFKDSIQETVKAGQEAFGQLATALKGIGSELGKLPVEKVKTDLAGVGEAGKQALKQVGEAAAGTKLDLPVAAPKQQLSELAQFARKTFDDIKGGISGVKAEIENTIKSVVGFKTAVIGLATAGAVGGVYQFVKSGIEDFNNLKKKADEAKLSLEEFQKLRFIYQEFGLSAKDADKAIADNAANFESSTATRTGSNNTGGKIITTNEVVNADSLRRLAQAVALIDDYGRKVERAQVLLKSKDLATSFVDAQDSFEKRLKEAGTFADYAEGSLKRSDIRDSGIDEFIVRYEALREVLKSGEQSAKEFTDAQKNLNRALLEVGFSSQQGRTSLALMLAPTLTPIIGAIAEGIRSLNINFAELGRTVGNAVKPAIADLFKLFSGGGAQIDSSQLGSSFGKAINEFVIPAFRSLKDIAIEAAHGLSELFGGDVRPALMAVGAVVVALIGPFNALAVAVLAVFGSSSPAITAFKNNLKSVGVDIDAIKQSIVQTFEEFKRALRGDEGTKGTLGASLAEGLKELPKIILEVVAALVLLRSGAAFLAKTGLFGKNISGDALIGVAAIGQLTGAFGVLRDIVTTVGVGLFALFNALRIVSFVLAPFVATIALITGIPAAVIAAIGIGIAALAAAIYLYWDEIKAGAKAAWDYVATAAQAAWEKIKASWVASAFNSVWEGIKDGAKDAWDFVIAKMQTALDKLREFLGVQKAAEAEHKALDEAPSAQKDFVPRAGKWVRPAPATAGEGGGADAPSEGGGGDGGDIPASAKPTAGTQIIYSGNYAGSKIYSGNTPNGTIYSGNAVRDEALSRAPRNAPIAAEVNTGLPARQPYQQPPRGSPENDALWRQFGREFFGGASEGSRGTQGAANPAGGGDLQRLWKGSDAGDTLGGGAKDLMQTVAQAFDFSSVKSSLQEFVGDVKSSFVFDQEESGLSKFASDVRDAFAGMSDGLAQRLRGAGSLADNFNVVAALPGLGGGQNAEAAQPKAPVYIQFKDSTVGPVFADDQILAALQRLANSGQLDSTGRNGDNYG